MLFRSSGGTTGGDNGDNGDQPPADPNAKYKLTGPETVGQFKRAKGPETQPLDEDDQQDLGVSNATELQVVYTLSGDTAPTGNDKGINFAGGWGDIADPGKTVDTIMEQAKQAAGQSTATAQQVNPSGMDNATVKCMEVPTGTVCVWADNSTFAMVISAKLESGKSQSVPMEEAINNTATLYKSARQPL